MKTLRSTIVMIAVISVLVSAVLVAQQPDSAKPAEPKYTEVKYEADQSSYKWVGEDRVLALSGHVKFIHGDTIIYADKIDYRESTRIATATGNLKIYDDQNTVTGEKCVVNFKEKKGTLTGNIVLVAKPKPKTDTKTATAAADTSKPKTLKDEWKDEVTITCDKADFYYKEKRAVVPGPLKMVQKTRTITADSGTYLGKDEVVELVGNIKASDEKDRHSFTAPSVKVSLKKDDEWIQAEKATGSFYIKEDDDTTKPEETPQVKPAEKAPVVPVKQ
jgi:lipopolysaccharide assembly outer membrane protein LptD (OstA)